MKNKDLIAILNKFDLDGEISFNIGKYDLYKRTVATIALEDDINDTSLDILNDLEVSAVDSSYDIGTGMTEISICLFQTNITSEYFEEVKNRIFLENKEKY